VVSTRPPPPSRRVDLAFGFDDERIDERSTGMTPAGENVTVLFTDMVDSTRLSPELSVDAADALRQPGETVAITYSRSGRSETTTVTLAPQP
jgi:class 3 adenylate cyclase